MALHGSVAEWSKALVLGTSLFGGVGSNPTAVTCFSLFSEVKAKQKRNHTPNSRDLQQTPRSGDVAHLT